MSCAEELRQLLAPLRVYDLNAPINGASLETKGAALDTVSVALEELEQESGLTTAEGWGLEQWKALFSMLPAAQSTDQMRSSIWALMRIGTRGATLQAVRDTLEGCGLKVSVEEAGTGKVRLRFPNVAGEPDNFKVLRANIEEILPAHVEVIYEFNYLTWEMLESYNWRMRHLGNLTWDRLERYVRF